MIELDAVSKRYPGATTPALDALTLSIPSGSRFGLLGPNGAGKTTLISLLLGLREPDRGSIRVNGLDPHHERQQIAGFTGLAPQELAFYPDLTVAENLRIFGKLANANADGITEAIEICGLGERLDSIAHALSGGLQRRLNLALALVHRPRLLLLDEPTVGVDPQSRGFILDSLTKLSEAGITLLYTTHYMEEIQRLCSHVAIMDRGQVLTCGTLDEVLQDTSAAVTVQIDDAIVTLNSLAELAERLPTWERNGANIQKIQYGVGNLEDRFMALTGRGLREE